MKQRINITIEPNTHKEGVLQAKKKSKKRNKYVSFSSHIEELITDFREYVEKEKKS